MLKKGPARWCRPKAASTQARVCPDGTVIHPVIYPDGTVMPSLKEVLKSLDAPARSLQQPMGQALPPAAMSASVAIRDEEHVLPVPTEPPQQPFNLEMELDRRVALAGAGAVIVAWWRKLLHSPEVLGDEGHVGPVPMEPQTCGGLDISTAPSAELPQQPMGPAIPLVATSAPVAVVEKFEAIPQTDGGSFSDAESPDISTTVPAATPQQPVGQALPPVATSASVAVVEEFEATGQMDGGDSSDEGSEECVIDYLPLHRTPSPTPPTPLAATGPPLPPAPRPPPAPLTTPSSQPTAANPPLPPAPQTHPVQLPIITSPPPPPLSHPLGPPPRPINAFVNYPIGQDPNAAWLAAWTANVVQIMNKSCPKSTPIKQSVKRTPRNPDNHLLRTVLTANGEHLGVAATGASSHTLLPLPLHIPRPTPISSPFSHPHPSSPLYLPLPSHLHLLPFPALLLYIHRQHALLRQLQVCVSMSMSMFMTPPAGLPPPH